MVKILGEIKKSGWVMRGVDENVTPRSKVPRERSRITVEKVLPSHPRLCTLISRFCSKLLRFVLCRESVCEESEWVSVCVCT